MMIFNRVKNNLIIISIVLLLTSSCLYKTEDSNSSKEKSYSISIGSFSTYEKALEFKSNLSERVRKWLRVELVSKKKHKLLYGRFRTNFEAGENAITLFREKEISKYDITFNGQKVFDDFCNVLFISPYLSKPSVYSYNIKSKQIEVVFNRTNKKVLALNMTKDASNAFITIADLYGKQGGIPFIKQASLYLLYRNLDESSELKNFGNGFQAYTYWDTPDTFRINFTYPDSLNPRIVNQKICSYTTGGKEIRTTERSFDLLTQGFPVFPKPKFNLLSPNNKYQLRIVEKNDKTFIYILDLLLRSEELIVNSTMKIKDLQWNNLGDNFFIIFEGDKEKLKDGSYMAKNELWVVDAFNKKTTKVFKNAIYNNLLVRQKLLFFDAVINKINKIIIYDYSKDYIFDQIEMPGGASLNTLSGN